MVIELETWLSDGMGYVFGDPSISGIVLLAFFTAFVFLQDTRADGKAVILLPVAILATALIPWLSVLVALVAGTLIYFALSKLVSK